MKKLLFIFLLLIFTSNLSFAKGSDIFKKNYLTVGMYNQDCYPFFFHDRNNKLKGLDVAIANEIGKNLGVKIIFNREAKTFDMLTELIMSKKVDIVISWFSRTLKRAKKIRFSVPYFIDNQCLLVNRLKMPQLLEPKDYIEILNKKNMVIGTQYGTSYVYFLKKNFPLAKHKFYKTWKKCYSDILDGKIVAGLWSEIGILTFFDKHPEDGIKVKMIKLPFKDYIAVGVNPDNRQFAYWIDVFFKMKNYKFSPLKLIQEYKQK